MKHITKSPKETQKLGHFLLNKISLDTQKTGLVIALSGELGAGKTTLVQGLAKIIGIKTKVKSPTFNLIKHYPITNYELRIKKKIRNTKSVMHNFKHLYHIDCYRLNNHKDLLSLGIKDILKDKENIILIEWPEKIKKILSDKRIDIKIEHIDKNTRKIAIS